MRFRTTAAKYTFSGRIQHVGVESLRVTFPARDKPITEAQYTLLSMTAVIDGWVRDILWHGNQIAVPDSPSETHESPGVPVAPASLYLAQLRDRLGEQALRNIGR